MIVPTTELSDSVESSLRKVSAKGAVNAAQLAMPLLELHPEYGNKIAASIDKLKPTPGEKEVDEWLRDIHSLFDFAKLPNDANVNTEVAVTEPEPQIHGRQYLIGLALLEPKLRAQFDKLGFFDALCDELRESLEDILSDKGLSLLGQNQDGMADSVPNRADRAAETLEDDRLGRAAFARYLAERIKAVPDDESYSIHLYGPWGSGKTSVLNLLREHLEKGNWVIAEFNAWRNQHIRPPWWSLTETVFQQGKHKLGFWQRLKEYWWRFNTGKTHYTLGLIIVLWIAVFSFQYFGPQGREGELKDFVDWTKNVAMLITAIITIWGFVTTAKNSFLFGSARAARNYMELTSDPMESIKNYFCRLIERFQSQRLVIFVDDLDRCQSEYVIELLEGIQTLFKSAPVVFVIAADRQWLNACFNQAYSDFEPHVKELGKPLGTLFLEKAFQMASPVPGIPDSLRESYWYWLIEVKSKSEEDLESIDAEAHEYMSGAASDEEIYEKVRQSKGRSHTEQAAIREQAVVQLATNKIMERTEHTLVKYHYMLDPNPRSMKRLVNAYSLNRALQTLSDLEIDLDQMVLWTILSMQWPVLADYFEKYPEKLQQVLNEQYDELDSQMAELSRLPGVQKVLRGEPGGRALEKETIETCALLGI